MIGLVMAGGRGVRMGPGTEKLLLCYKKPAILHVTDSLIDSGRFQRILAVTSPNSPQTARLLEGQDGIETVGSAGAGYVEDLGSVLRGLDGPVMVVPGDLPLLDGQIVGEIADMFDPQKAWTGVLVTKGLADSLGLGPGYVTTFGGMPCRHTGISLVNAAMVSSPKALREDHVIVDDRRVAFNLNHRGDYELLGTL